MPSGPAVSLPAAAPLAAPALLAGDVAPASGGAPRAAAGGSARRTPSGMYVVSDVATSPTAVITGMDALGLDAAAPVAAPRHYTADAAELASSPSTTPLGIVAAVAAAPRPGGALQAPAAAGGAAATAGGAATAAAGAAVACTPPPARHVTARLAAVLLGTAPGALYPLPPAPSAAAWLLDGAVNAVPRGVAQVCFMDNPAVGLACFIALTAPMPAMYGACCLVGVVAATAWAWLLVAPADRAGAWRHGLYGFNGMLVGAAMATFTSSAVGGSLSPGRVVAHLAATAAAAGVATLLSLCLSNCWAAALDLPTFTMPFNLAALVALAAMSRWAAAPPQADGDAGWYGKGAVVFHTAALPTPSWASAAPNVTGAAAAPAWAACYSADALAAPPAGAPPAAGDCTAAVLAAIFRGVAQVYFCDSWVAGAVLVAAFACCSPIGGAAAFAGSGIGLATGVLLGADPAFAHAGLLGYNAVIGAMALCGVFFRFSAATVVTAAAGAAVCTLLQAAYHTAFAPLGMPVLTLPFCTAAILFLLAGRRWTTRVPLHAAVIAETHVRYTCCGVATCGGAPGDAGSGAARGSDASSDEPSGVYPGRATPPCCLCARRSGGALVAPHPPPSLHLL